MKIFRYAIRMSFGLLMILNLIACSSIDFMNANETLEDKLLGEYLLFVEKDQNAIPIGTLTFRDNETYTFDLYADVEIPEDIGSHINFVENNSGTYRITLGFGLTLDTELENIHEEKFGNISLVYDGAVINGFIISFVDNEIRLIHPTAPGLSWYLKKE